MSGRALQVVAELLIVKEHLQDLTSLFNTDVVPSSICHGGLRGDIDDRGATPLGLIDQTALFDEDLCVRVGRLRGLEDQTFLHFGPETERDLTVLVA